jgi:predicted MFS family arabinose efflux permease
MQSVVQAAQVLGFAGGGALVALIGTSGVLLADSGTFALSALLVWWQVRSRPAAAGRVIQHGWWADLATGGRLVWTDLRLRSLVLFACLSGFYIAGEALAVPYADGLGGGAITVGLMFAGYSAGTAAGMLLVGRLPTESRLRLLVPLSAGACAPLVVCFINPHLVVVVALFVLSGMGSAYHLIASTSFVLAVPDARRGQAFGLAVTALKVAQGLGVALAGLAAEAVRPHLVVGAAGALGLVAVAALAWTWRLALVREPAIVA